MPRLARLAFLISFGLSTGAYAAASPEQPLLRSSLDDAATVAPAGPRRISASLDGEQKLVIGKSVAARRIRRTLEGELGLLSAAKLVPDAGSTPARRLRVALEGEQQLAALGRAAFLARRIRSSLDDDQNIAMRVGEGLSPPRRLRTSLD